MPVVSSRCVLLFGLVLIVLLAPAGTYAQIDPVASTVTTVPSLRAFLTPDGTGSGLASPGATLVVTVVSTGGTAVTGLGPGAFEVDGFPLGSMSDAFFPPSPGPHDVGSLTVAGPGIYRLDGILYAGGCGTQMIVRVRGTTINSGIPVINPFHSPDRTGPGGRPDGVVNIADIGALALALGTSDPCFDFNLDGVVNLPDVGTFALYFPNTYPPGGVLDVD